MNQWEATSKWFFIYMAMCVFAHFFLFLILILDNPKRSIDFNDGFDFRKLSHSYYFSTFNASFTVFLISLDDSLLSFETINLLKPLTELSTESVRYIWNRVSDRHMESIQIPNIWIAFYWCFLLFHSFIFTAG